ncbi:hypothetical protein Hanom_Chr10g00964591 [Helianthus anomalus]
MSNTVADLHLDSLLACADAIRYVFMFSIMTKTKLIQHVVSEHMLISQFCFRIHYSGIEIWKTEF